MRPQLIGKILDREFVLLDLALEFLGLGLIVILLRLFDQAQHVAHAQDARGKAVGMKDLEGVELLAEYRRRVSARR